MSCHENHNGCDGGGQEINLVWRPRVVQWYYDFVDGLSEDRCVVYIAVNVLDRFCRTQAVHHPLDEKVYELSALASLFLAVRISGTAQLELDYLVSTSRLSITKQDLVNAGTCIINALKWEQKILTPHDFVHRFGTLLPRKGILCDRQSVLDVALYIVEISLFDDHLSRCDPAELGAAAMLIALGTNNPGTTHPFSEALYLSESIITGSEPMRKIQDRLSAVYNNSAHDAMIPDQGPHMIQDEDAEMSTTPPPPQSEYISTHPDHSYSHVHVITPDN